MKKVTRANAYHSQGKEDKAQEEEEEEEEEEGEEEEEEEEQDEEEITHNMRLGRCRQTDRF